MPEWWPLLLGWPAAFLSVTLAVGGIVSAKPGLIIVAAVLAAPFSFYLSLYLSAGWDSGMWVSVVFAAFLLTFVAAAYAVRQRRPWIASGLLVPFVGVAISLFIDVVSQ